MSAVNFPDRRTSKITIKQAFVHVFTLTDEGEVDTLF